jgi:hypothetical protein
MVEVWVKMIKIKKMNEENLEEILKEERNRDIWWII